MTIQDVINLANAGYTKEDIFKLTQAEKPKEAPANTETGILKPVPQLNGSNTPVQHQQSDPDISAIQNQLDSLKQMMQINNMLTVNQSAPKERTIDDIFAEIINPPVKENK